MDRQILFRGKRIDNGEWKYGGFVRNCEGQPIILPYDESGQYGSLIGHEVDPSTVGQYTGLKDKNGKEIYEGDIVLCRCPEGEFRAIIEFGNPNCFYSWGWQLKAIEDTHFNEDILLWIETELDNVTCEIVGNIHDKESEGC